MSERAAHHNVSTWLDHHAQERGEAEAVIDAWRRLSYAELAERTARAAGLLAQAGVGPGERVAVLLGNLAPYLEVVLAAARLGAMAVPVNVRWSQREIAQLLDDCTPHVVVHGEAQAETLERACAAARHQPALRLQAGAPGDPYEAALAAAPPRPAAPVSPDDPMILMYTSGTTGAPKGALLPHRKTLYNARNAEIFFRMEASDRVLVVVPLFHSFGLAILALPTLHVGGTLVLHAHFDPASVWRAVGEERIRFFGAVPTMFRALHEELEAAPGRYSLASLRFLFTSGAPIPVELIRAYERRGLVLKQGFGQTETSTLTCLDAADAVRKAGSVGRPVPFAEVRVVRRDTLEEAPGRWRDVVPGSGEAGEIIVRGPITMLGYWNRPEETAATLRGGWLHTGDLASVDAEGFLTLVGRARDLFISGGENVYPAEVEAVLETYPGLREVAVVGVPDERWGEVGCAFVVLEPGATLEPEAIKSWARDKLASFKIPRRFVAVAGLPRTETGKVQKWKLATAAGGAGAEGHAA